MAEKTAVSSRVGGFQQTRKGTRSYRVDTLTKKQVEQRPSEQFEPDHPSKPNQDFEAALAGTAGEEFNKEAFAPVRLKKTAAELKTELLPYQKRVIKKMRNQSGLVVAHGTGTGKTLSSIGAAVDLNVDKAKVFVPAALQENYKKEVVKHVRGQLPVEVQTIEKAVRDGNPPRGDLLVVDEAHRLRNPSSKGYQLLGDASVKKRMLLTASPVYNRPEDIAPLVNLAAGSKQLPTGSEFNRKFIKKPSKGLFAVINPWATKEPKIINRRELGSVLGKWVDYQGGSEAGFPSLSEERINVPMTKRQSELHGAAWGKLPWTTRVRVKHGLPPDKKDLGKINTFQAQTRQISSSEKRYTTEDVQSSPKIQAAVGNLEGRLKQDIDHKALVYANYLGTLDDYSKELQSRNISHAMFRGDMSRKVRNKAVESLNKGDVKALLVSGAGGEGLDLKGVRQVQVLEPHWNDEKLKQVIGRARRYKSHAHLPPEKRNVHVERYAARPRGVFYGTNKGIEDTLYNMSDQKQKLNDQVTNLLVKSSAERYIQEKNAAARPGPKEFAPGIPKKRKILSIPKVKERSANQEWMSSLSTHPAAKRGDHLDLRLVDPRGKAHSFALNNMPEPGKSTYAVQQATHSGSYALRKKPFSIPLGVYGGTRPGAKVEPKYVQPIEVIQADNKRVHLLRHSGQETEELVMRQVARAGDNVPIWALTNATKNRNTREGKRLPDAKPRYKDSGVDAVDFSDDQQVMTPKIDGSHTITDFPKADRMVRTYSYRPTQRKSGLIEHTFKFPNFHKLKTPKSLQGTMVRTETWASKDGKAIPASEIGGLLNSGVPRARNLQADRGIKLRRTVIDVVKHRGRDVSNKPYAEKLRIMREVSKGTKGAIEMPFVAETPSQKKRMLSVVKGGKFPQTKEGIVLHEMNTSGPPTKVKIRPDTDVYVRGVFTKKTSPKGQAAGFEYALKPDGPVVGRVGTGLSRDLRRQMRDAPERFVGRVAKVRSAGQHVTRGGKAGALIGSPSFKEWHIDKSPPELLKEGARWYDEAQDMIEDIPDEIEDRLEDTREARVAKGFLKAKPVKKQVGRLRSFYRKYIGGRND